MTSRKALLSVSDKTGIVDFARKLHEAGLELLSTGGTSKSLREAGLPVMDVSDLTQFPEILDGRVKTLHPAVHAGLLAKDSDDHAKTMEQHQFSFIDVVVVNLYPFEETVAQPGVTKAQAIEKIDVGGPTMLRAAAKNHGRVTVVCDPADYDAVADELNANGKTSEETRYKLACKVFARTAAYDQAITSYFASLEAESDSDFPATLSMSFPIQQSLRYGENPHQRAAFYRDPRFTETSLATAKQIQGKELSYNNILDAEGALEMIRDFADLAPAAAVIIKHSNPCGIAVGDDLLTAYDRARSTDPNSAFGGIVAVSCELDKATAERIGETFNEVVIAPSVSDEAKEVLAAKKNLRVLETGNFTSKQKNLIMRGIVGGVLVTDRDLGLVTKSDLKVVTRLQPTDEELAGLLFAWRCVKWVKSNAIVYTNHFQTLGIGAGQMSRVDSARIGVDKGTRDGHNLNGCFMASDAFFPFRDNIDEASKTGVKGIIQPGGSIRDEEVIQAADEHEMFMVLTGMRHFRH